MAPLSLAAPSVDNTVGAVFLGMLGACALFGVTSVQAYMYFHNYPKDSRWNKTSVVVLWILDTLHLTLTIHAMYTYIVKGFANHTQIIHIVWSMKLQVVVMVIIIVLVQSLYAVRIWLLSGYHRGFLRYLVPVAVGGGFAIGIVFSYQTYQQATFQDLTSIAWALDSSLAAATLIDFFLALCMCYYLRKSRTSERQLNSRISTVMQYSLSSGLLTSTCSLSALFTYILLPYTLIFISLEFLMTRLYVGSFLAMLNSRQHRPEDGVARTSVHLGTVNFRTSHPSSDGRSRTDSDADSEKYTALPKAKDKKKTNGIKVHRVVQVV